VEDRKIIRVRVIGAAVLALFVSACAGDPPASTTSTVSSSPTPDPASGEDRSFPFEDAPVVRGRFSPDAFGPLGELTLGAGWRLTFDTKAILGFVKDRTKDPSTVREQTLAFARVTKVFENPLIPAERLGEPLNVRDTPDDLSAWIHGLRFLDATDVRETKVGGIAAKRFGARFDPSVGLPNHCNPPICVTWASSDTQPLVLIKGPSLMFWTLRVRGESVLVVAAAPDSVSDTFFVDVSEALQTARWG
jgi:hypothetical protein